ncbi:MAG TPA: hypothetical protein VGZ22_23745 [Isosphaeraceae bacterium]|jgi:hypothetical protein|nr:hypothetical protein [Isosphaeraceae bacterium]
MLKFLTLQSVRPARGVVSVAMVALGLACAGCGEKMSGAYVPSTQTARQALETALQAWQNGQKPEEVAKAASPVNVMDQVWQSGQKLNGFTIVSEDPSDDTKKFTVSLDLTDPKGKSKNVKREAHYYVLGQGPIWVYREEDYMRMVNMDNNTQPAQRRPGAPR